MHSKIVFPMYKVRATFEDSALLLNKSNSQFVYPFQFTYFYDKFSFHENISPFLLNRIP